MFPIDTSHKDPQTFPVEVVLIEIKAFVTSATDIISANSYSVLFTMLEYCLALKDVVFKLTIFKAFKSVVLICFSHSPKFH